MFYIILTKYRDILDLFAGLYPVLTLFRMVFSHVDMGLRLPTESLDFEFLLNLFSHISPWFPMAELSELLSSCCFLGRHCFQLNSKDKVMKCWVRTVVDVFYTSCISLYTMDQAWYFHAYILSYVSFHTSFGSDEPVQITRWFCMFINKFSLRVYNAVYKNVTSGPS